MGTIVLAFRPSPTVGQEVGGASHMSGCGDSATHVQEMLLNSGVGGSVTPFRGHP